MSVVRGPSGDIPSAARDRERSVCDAVIPRERSDRGIFSAGIEPRVRRSLAALGMTQWDPERFTIIPSIPKGRPGE
jgi:hypothetical protein